MDEATAREIVVSAVQDHLAAGAPLPDDSADLETSGLVDSMRWVEILVSIESRAGLRNFGQSWPEGRARSIAELIAALQAAGRESAVEKLSEGTQAPETKLGNVTVAGWSHTLGSIRKDVEEVEREFNLATGLLAKGAGIESVRIAGDGEDEISMGRDTAESALEKAGVEADDVDLLVVTSATWLGVPSPSAGLHNALLLRTDCLALDVGGACVGLLNALSTADAMLKVSGRKTALVVAAEKHSRWQDLLRGRGEFAGLFGDGACAFVLEACEDGAPLHGFQLGKFFWECDGSRAPLLRLGLNSGANFMLEFRGEQLGKAAVEEILRILSQLETLSGRKTADVDFFAIHEGNPRLVEIIATRVGAPPDKLAFIAKGAGNLGSVTCGAALCEGMTRVACRTTEPRRPLIFMAAVGPGLIGAGTYFS